MGGLHNSGGRGGSGEEGKKVFEEMLARGRLFVILEYVF